MAVVVSEDDGFWLLRGHPGHTLGIPKGKNANGQGWEFNGNYESPTFSPSIREMEKGGHHYSVANGICTYHDDQRCPDCPSDGIWVIPPWEDFEIPEGQRGHRG